MNSVEIERKFLVKNLEVLKNRQGISIVQGYLNTDKARSVRIRIQDKQAFITVKGNSNQSGLSRFEWEKEINIEEAKKLLPLCEYNLIEKTRYTIIYKGHKFEIDVFEKEHQGLVVAEIELESENQFFEKPNWLGEEVTGRREYYNVYLAKNSL